MQDLTSDPQRDLHPQVENYCSEKKNKNKNKTKQKTTTFVFVMHKGKWQEDPGDLQNQSNSQRSTVYLDASSEQSIFNTIKNNTVH